MVVVSDISSILYAGWILGCTVLIATKNDVKARRFRDIIIVSFSIIVYLISLILLHVYVLLRKNVDPKGQLIVLMRNILLYLCLFVDVSLTTLWNWKIRFVLSQLRNFDRVTKFRDSARGNILRNVCRIKVVVGFFYWMIVGYLSYSTEPVVPLFRGITYFVLDASLNIQIQIFACILFLVEERFRHLCSMVTFPRGDDKLIVADRLNDFTLHQIWWLHCSLVNATEMINSVYKVQLLLWISSLSVNLLSRIYRLNAYKLLDYEKIRELMMAINCMWNLGLVTAICHVTADQANRVGEIIFSPYSPVSMRRTFFQENLEAATYFQLRKLHLFAVGGIIRVNLPLLLLILSAMTTYLVILS